MILRRVATVALAGVGYPALLFTVAVGVLTFTTVDVFAEAYAPPACWYPSISACASSTNGECSGCSGGRCGCFRSHCSDGGGPYIPALVCRLMLSCYDTPFAECLGKSWGETCAPGKRCWPWPNRCAVLRDGGHWEYPIGPNPMTCQDVPSDGGAVDGGGSGEPLGPDGGTDASVDVPGDASSVPQEAGGDVQAPIANDAGCSLGGESGGLNTAAFAGLGVSAAALVARWRMRRQRSRRG